MKLRLIRFVSCRVSCAKSVVMLFSILVATGAPIAPVWAADNTGGACSTTGSDSSSTDVKQLSGLDCKAILGGYEKWIPLTESDSCSESTPADPIDPSDNQQWFFNYFVSKKVYTPEQVAGMMGNIQAESHFDPKIYQGGGDYSTPPGSNGWGIVQWTPSSKIVNYATAVKKDPSLLSTQAEFLWKQLEGTTPGKVNSEKAAGDALKKTTSATEAAVSFLVNYERAKDSAPDGPNAILRSKFAAQMLALYGGSGAVSTDVSASGSSSCTPSGSLLDSGTGDFTTASTKYPGVNQMIARARKVALPQGGDGSLFHAVCDNSPVGDPECYGACANTSANVWGFSHFGKDYAVGSSASNGGWEWLKSIGHAHPGDRNPPVGALLFYSTGKIAGHVGVYMGENLVFSTDVGDSDSGIKGGAYIVPAHDLEGGAWSLNYLGWGDPLFGGSSVHYGGL